MVEARSKLGDEVLDHHARVSTATDNSFKQEAAGLHGQPEEEGPIPSNGVRPVDPDLKHACQDRDSC